MPGRLANKVALLTGAGSGLGEAIDIANGACSWPLTSQNT
jgi:NADP-dependent 3-hydroxy acid dehydrogenase YdfG